MSELYIWRCIVDSSKYTEEEAEYRPAYDYYDSYVVIAASAEDALYHPVVRRNILPDGRDLEISDVKEYSLPLTAEEHLASRARYSSGIYPIRDNWVAEQITPYIGDPSREYEVLVSSYNAG